MTLRLYLICNLLACLLTLLISPCLAQVIQVNSENPEQQGKHYRFPEFEQGQVIQQTGESIKALLNYNLITEEMVVDLGHTKMPYQPPGFVHRIILNDVDFLHIDGQVYEVLYEGEIPLLVHRKQTIGRAGQNTGLGTTSATSSTILPPALYDKKLLYQMVIPGDYILIPSSFYFLKTGDEIVPIRKMKTFDDVFSNIGPDLKAYLKVEKPKLDNESDLINLTKFCNDSNR